VTGGAGTGFGPAGNGSSARFGRRFAALIYDSLLLAALLMLYTAGWIVFMPGHVAVTRDSAGGWYFLYVMGEILVIACYYTVNWVRSGQTLGMRAWRLKALAADGGALRWRSAALRFLCGVLAWPPAALGVLWLYFDPDHLAIHDRLSRTRVVRVNFAQ
jgi:uncharacterized RDD family membrane protein YckC